MLYLTLYWTMLIGVWLGLIYNLWNARSKQTREAAFVLVLYVFRHARNFHLAVYLNIVFSILVWTTLHRWGMLSWAMGLGMASSQLYSWWSAHKLLTMRKVHPYSQWETVQDVVNWVPQQEDNQL